MRANSIRSVDSVHGSKLIELEHVSVSYAGHLALNDVSLSLFQGEHCVLSGDNGTGKSTLLRVLRGEQWIDNTPHGRVIWWQKSEADESALTGRSMVALISAAQQERILAQGWAINGEDLIFGGMTDAIYVLRHAEGEQRARILQLAEALEACDFLERPIPSLSQGQLRLLLIARGLIRNPEVLLLDEITDGLDVVARQRILECLERVAQTTTLVFATHRSETVPQWVRREIVMEKGRLICDVPNRANRSEHLVTKHDKTAGLSVPCVDSMVASHIQIVNADVYVENHLVLHKLNWEINKGEHWAVCGENGAGKSTLLRLLAGDEYPAFGGRIHRILSSCGGEARALAEIRRGIRLVSDLLQAQYGYALSGLEFVLSGVDNSVGLYRVMNAEEKTMAYNGLELLGVKHLAERSIRACSTGEMRRLMLARAFIGDPDFLLLDEPCSGLDPSAREHLLDILQILTARGTQLIYVSHHEHDLPNTLTHLLRLEQGHITYKGPKKQSIPVLSCPKRI